MNRHYSDIGLTFGNGGFSPWQTALVNGFVLVHEREIVVRVARMIEYPSCGWNGIYFKIPGESSQDLDVEGDYRLQSEQHKVVYGDWSKPRILFQQY